MKKALKAENALRGKNVVITGATSGVGLAAAEAFAREGCNIAIIARGLNGINKAVERCRDLNVHVIGISADMSVFAQVENALEEALAKLGGIDIWINNAGVMASGKFEEIPMEVHQQVIKTNLFGYMHGAYSALKLFKEQDRGILINNVSIGGFMPAPYSAVYSGSKYGIRGMMECLQGEVSNRSRIHICNLYPQLQNSTGNLHSAKYSGFDIAIPFTASDPRDSAAKMVELAKSPKKDLFPDLRSAAIVRTYGLFPKPVINTASAAMRIKMKINADKTGNSGNVLSESKEPLRVHGKMPAASNTKTAIALAAFLGFALGLLALNRKH